MPMGITNMMTSMASSFLEHSGFSILKREDRNRELKEFYGVSAYSRPDRVQFKYGNERSIVNSIYTRIGIDCAAISIQHVRVDENGRFSERIDSGLDYCLNVEANLDQTGRAFIQDVVMSLCDEGCVAILPVLTDVDPETKAFKIEKLRVGKILQWHPHHIRVSVYDEDTGDKKELVVSKRIACIIENPLYSVMNEPNSTLKRLIGKLALLDSIDANNGSGKLDLIIQLPYTIRSPQKRELAENRRKDIEMQLTGSKYGIAYVDATERITQLNRPVENNLLTQIQSLKTEFYNQLGLTEAVFNGTASSEEMLNYHNRTIEPILSAITLELTRKFLSSTARTQGQKIMFFRDPFKMTPVEQMADIADKFTRNEILSPNEIRAIIGYKPDSDPKSDELRNRNINQNGNAEQQGATSGLNGETKVNDIIDKLSNNQKNESN